MTRRQAAITVRRMLTIVVVWAAAFALLSWLDLQPAPVGLLALVGCAVLGYTAYASSKAPWTAPLWRKPSLHTRVPQHTDGRLRFIRRIIESAIDTGSAANAEHHARRMQSLLREVAVQRLSGRPERATNTDPIAGLASTAPELHAYLSADPPPRLTLHHIRDVVDRIEDL